MKNIDYFMFSFEFNKHGKIESIDFYNKYYNYRFIDGNLYKRNDYTFYHLSQIQDIKDKINRSIYKEKKLKGILIPELVKSVGQCICVSKKYMTDSVYFGRIDFEALLYFLNYFNYNKVVIDFIKKNKNGLKNMRFDIGFDYIIENNEVKYTKS
jgi:hypothetical protein